MNAMSISVVDERVAAHVIEHPNYSYLVIGALSDDPETVEEFWHALLRFLPKGTQLSELSDSWKPGACEQPAGDGICLVDLPARLIVFQSRECEFHRSGVIPLDEESEASESGAAGKRQPSVAFQIHPEWEVVSDIEQWRKLAETRREERRRCAPSDTRKVLYREVAEFIARQSLEARGGGRDELGHWVAPDGWDCEQLPIRVEDGRCPTARDGIAEIHARWLMTPRADLGDRTPRDVLVKDRSHLMTQMENREHQWTYCGECPPPLWRESAAYKYGGYGDNEIIVYYELVRELTKRAWAMLVRPEEDPTPDEVERAIEELKAIQQDWLHTPDAELWLGKTPAWIIERERLRLPLGDIEDIPLSEEAPEWLKLSAMAGPSFCHFDRSGMDGDYPFDFDALAPDEVDFFVEDLPDGLPRSEEEWEETLEKSDFLAVKFAELAKSLADPADRDSIDPADVDACEAALRRVRPAGGFQVDEELQREVSERFDLAIQSIDAFIAADRWSKQVAEAFGERIDELRESDAEQAELVTIAVVDSLSVVLKIVGGHGLGDDDDHICGNIVCCKQALSEARGVIGALEKLKPNVAAPPEVIEAQVEQGRNVCERLEERIGELRSRIWW